MSSKDCGDGPDGGRRADTGSARDDAGVACARPPLLPVIELEHSIVRYDDRPDRCTVFPPDASDVARLSTWLSLDAEHVCSLEAWR